MNAALAQLPPGRSILVVDDHAPIRQLLVSYLTTLGCRSIGASGGIEGLDLMSKENFDIVLLDLRMDDIDGLEVLKRARAQGLAHNCVMMSAEGTIGHAVEAIRLGATDFLVKPFELPDLLAVVQRVLGSAEGSPRAAKDSRLAWRDRHAPGLIGEHQSLLDVFLVLERIANTDCTVLVLGESGTGKELVSRAVHSASNRRDNPFVPVNCGAIPEALIESELFGHTKGAFTGAIHTREGRFAVADHGTLFLDEIGEMSLQVQVKFLRVLQEQEYVPVGETRPRKCDVRIIAATNKNLEVLSREGKFRDDLFHRLNLIPIHLPALRERVSDIPILAHHFLDVFNRRRGFQLRGFTSEVLELLQRYDWPGNVRELENIVERMTLLHQGTGLLDLSDLPPRIQQLASSTAAPVEQRFDTSPPAPTSGLPPPTSVPSSPSVSTPIRPVVPSSPPSSSLLRGPVTSQAPTTTTAADPAAPGRSHDGAALLASDPEAFVLPDEGLDLRRAVEAFEMSLIRQALQRTDNNRNQASQLLRMNRTTLVEKLRKWQSRGPLGTEVDPVEVPPGEFDLGSSG